MGGKDGEKMETVMNFIFLGSKITADGDHCTFQGAVILGRKTKTNLDNVLKSRNTTLLKRFFLYSQSYDFSRSHVWM